MLPWIPMSPPGCCFRAVTYSMTGVVTRLVFAHSWSGVLDVTTCLGVSLMKSANGWMSEVGQYPTQ